MTTDCLPPQSEKLCLSFLKNVGMKYIQFPYTAYLISFHRYQQNKLYQHYDLTGYRLQPVQILQNQINIILNFFLFIPSNNLYIRNILCLLFPSMKNQFDYKLPFYLLLSVFLNPEPIFHDI